MYIVVSDIVSNDLDSAPSIVARCHHVTGDCVCSPGKLITYHLTLFYVPELFLHQNR